MADQYVNLLNRCTGKKFLKHIPSDGLTFTGQSADYQDLIFYVEKEAAEGLSAIERMDFREAFLRV